MFPLADFITCVGVLSCHRVFSMFVFFFLRRQVDRRRQDAVAADLSVSSRILQQNRPGRRL